MPNKIDRYAAPLLFNNYTGIIAVCVLIGNDLLHPPVLDHVALTDLECGLVARAAGAGAEIVKQRSIDGRLEESTQPEHPGGWAD